MKSKFKLKLGERMSGVTEEKNMRNIYTATRTPEGNEYIVTWEGDDYDARYSDKEVMDAIHLGYWVVVD